MTCGRWAGLVGAPLRTGGCVVYRAPVTFPLIIAAAGLILTFVGGVIAANKTGSFEWKHFKEPGFIALILGLIVGAVGVAAEALSA